MTSSQRRATWKFALPAVVAVACAAGTGWAIPDAFATPAQTRFVTLTDLQDSNTQTGTDDLRLFTARPRPIDLVNPFGGDIAAAPAADEEAFHRIRPIDRANPWGSGEIVQTTPRLSIREP